METPQGFELPDLSLKAVGLAGILAVTSLTGCGGVVHERPATGEGGSGGSEVVTVTGTGGEGGSGGTEVTTGTGGQGGFVEEGGAGGIGGTGGAGGQAGGPDFLTRGGLVVELVQDVMQGINDASCVPTFSDTPANSDICNAVEILQKRGLLLGFEDGTFHPELVMARAEVWAVVANALGFAKYNAPCLNGIQDLDPINWVYGNAGAICEKGLTITELDGLAHPLDSMTLGDWATMKSELGDYFAQPLTRAGAAEIAEVILRKVAIPPIPQCQSYFVDVPNDTLNCFTINDLVDNGIMNGYVDANGNPLGIFGPDDGLVDSQLVELEVLAAALPLDNCDSCSGSNPGTWYCSYADTLCHDGLIDNSFDPNALSSRRGAYSLAWNVDAGEKLFSN